MSVSMPFLNHLRIHKELIPRNGIFIEFHSNELALSNLHSFESNLPYLFWHFTLCSLIF